MSQKRPQAGERFLHFKNKLYQVLTIARHSETGEELVVYQALYGKYQVYARPLAMFAGEVDHEKYPEVTQKYRFQLVSGDGAPGCEEEAADLEVIGAFAFSGPEGDALEHPAVEEDVASDGGSPKQKLPYVNERKAEAQPRSERRSQFARQPQSPVVRKVPEGQKRTGEVPVEELLMDFYDARSYGGKYQILLQMEKGLTDVMIDNMAVALDVVIPEGPLEKRYEELKRCVRTYERYEMNRLK